MFRILVTDVGHSVVPVDPVDLTTVDARIARVFELGGEGRLADFADHHCTVYPVDRLNMDVLRDYAL